MGRHNADGAGGGTSKSAKMLSRSAAVSSGSAGSYGGSPMVSSVDAMLCCCFPLGRL